MDTWIVAANAGRARIYLQASATASLEEIDDMVNEASRLRTADTETDDLGRRNGSTSRSGGNAPSQPNGYQPHQNPVEHQNELFARSLAAYLLQGHQGHRFGQLRLVASPSFLGLLRKQIDPQLQSCVKSTLDKDYTSCTAAQLLKLLRAAEP